MAYRSAYWPVKAISDGDLCAQYPTVIVGWMQAMHGTEGGRKRWCGEGYGTCVGVGEGESKDVA
jgi:hypothetical protein